MTPKEFSPIEMLEKMISKWWLLFLAMLLGGLLGFAISMVQAPRYESVAQISTNIDYQVAPEIEDYMEDRAINEAGWVIISEGVLKSVHAQAEEEGLPITYRDVIKDFSTERIDDLWNLRVAGENAEDAALLANLWVGEAYAQLDTAIEHAQSANVLGVYIASLQDCSETNNGLAICALENTDALSEEIEEKTTLLNEELELSKALHPAMRAALVSHAQVPTAPVFHTRGLFVLSGAALGLLFGLLYLLLRPEKGKADA